MIKNIVYFSFFAVVLFVSSNLFAQNAPAVPTGKVQEWLAQVTDFSGDVQVQKSAVEEFKVVSKKGPNVINGAIFKSGGIKTAKGAKATLKLSEKKDDKNFLTVEEDTTIYWQEETIDKTKKQMKWTNKTALRKIIFPEKKGKISGTVKTKELDFALQFETPLGIVAVKGTSFSFQIGDFGITITSDSLEDFMIFPPADFTGLASGDQGIGFAQPGATPGERTVTFNYNPETGTVQCSTEGGSLQIEITSLSSGTSITLDVESGTSWHVTSDGKIYLDEGSMTGTTSDGTTVTAEEFSKGYEMSSSESTDTSGTDTAFSIVFDDTPIINQTDASPSNP
jgi:hypothetical protein